MRAANEFVSQHANHNQIEENQKQQMAEENQILRQGLNQLVDMMNTAEEKNQQRIDFMAERLVSKYIVVEGFEKAQNSMF